MESIGLPVRLGVPIGGAVSLCGWHMTIRLYGIALRDVGQMVVSGRLGSLGVNLLDLLTQQQRTGPAR